MNNNNRKLNSVSIITPNYNMGEYLEDTIISVLSQNYPNIQYIIIDGGSTDNSLNIIKKYEKYLYYWISEPDKGQSQALNKGFIKSSGEIIGWINSDDILAEGAVDYVINNFLLSPEIDVIYGKVKRINAKGEHVQTPILPKDLIEFNKQSIIGESIVNQPGAFFRRLWIDRVGLLNENLHYSMDFEYWVRLVLAGAKFKRVPKELAYFRLNPKSKTVNQTINMAREHLDILGTILNMKDLEKSIQLERREIDKRVKQTKAILFLYIVNGYIKNGDIREASKWFLSALKMSPTIIFQERWLKLALARIKR